MEHEKQGGTGDFPLNSEALDGAPTILIVEDEQIVAADIRNRLQALGYSVPAIVSSGEEALAKIPEIRPDVLVMDIVLHGPMDGIETAKQVRAAFDLPIVYLTAYTDEETAQRAKITEPYGYILKPFDERELRFAIEMALHKHRLETGVRQREKQFEQIAENPLEILWLIDCATSAAVYVSPACEQSLGRTAKELTGSPQAWTDPIHDDDRQRVVALYKKACRGEAADTPEEYRILRPDGSIRWMATRVFPVRDVSGNVYRIAGTAQDITPQKWAWDNLSQSEERYRIMAENSNDLISRHTPEGIYLYASPASRTLLGYRPEELLGTSAYSYIHPDDTERFRSRDVDSGHFLSAGGETYRIRKKDGSYVWFESTAKTLCNPATGEIQEVTVVSRDISERKWAAEALGRYEFIANSSQEFMTLINRDYVYEAANNAYCTAHGKSRAEIIGHKVNEVWGDEAFTGIIKGYLDECFTGKTVRYESWFKFGAQQQRFFEVHYYPYINDAGVTTHCVVVSHDMSQRKSSEDQLQSSLKEKEILLKEIHHRVKNNLQIISSLLSLQSSTIEDAPTRELVRESQNRVRSMALIHEKLYQAASLARIDFGEYLRSLTRDLFRSYSAGGVSLKMQAEDVFLDVDSAIPCGLIVNELVSNALKYAFPQGRGGELLITFARIARDKFALSVTDNGTGLPSDLDVRNPKTLGLQLVAMLINQLHGTLDVVSDGGTTFMITFSTEKEKNPRATYR